MVAEPLGKTPVEPFKNSFFAVGEHCYRAGKTMAIIDRARPPIGIAARNIGPLRSCFRSDRSTRMAGWLLRIMLALSHPFARNALTHRKYLWIKHRLRPLFQLRSKTTAFDISHPEAHCVATLTGVEYMHLFTRTIAAASLALACATVCAQQNFRDAGFWTTPTIQGYGRIHMSPHAAYQPDKSATYKIVFALTKAPKTPAGVNPSLDRVARTVNLYVAAGVPVAHLKIVAIAYGEATALALNDDAYRARFGTANPNLPLIALLRKAGVDVAVCSQAVAEQELPYDAVDKSVTVALSGLVTITTLEHNGYDLMPM